MEGTSSPDPPKHLESRFFRFTGRFADFVGQVGRGNLRTLDFTRIKDVERAAARRLFTDPTTSLPTALAHQLSTSIASVPGATAMSNSKSSFSPGLTAKGGKGRLMTPDEKKKVVEALTRAKTAEEVRKLERMLAEGLIPEGEVVTVNGS